MNRVNKIVEKLIRGIVNPNLLLRELWKRIPVGSFGLRCQFDAFERPYYAFGIYYAAKLAKALGVKKISIIEFGVGGGDGLLLMEKMVDEVSHELDINIEIYGFDAGLGLPRPKDFRDIPYLWREGDYKMDFNRLARQLRKAQLVIGDVKDTVQTFTQKYNPAPIGFVVFDLDFYSSTTEALKIFNSDNQYLLPRVLCYFDDVYGNQLTLFNDYTGELLSIKEFNEKNSHMKLCKINNFYAQRYIKSPWGEAMYGLHLFHHKLYNKYISDKF